MEREEMEAKAEEVRARMKAERVEKIVSGLIDHDLLNKGMIDKIKEDIGNWNNEQLEAQERFIEMAVDHARMKKALHEAKINLQSEQVGVDLNKKEVSQESIADALTTIKDYAAKMSPETLDQVSAERRKQILEETAGAKMHKGFKSDYDKIMNSQAKAKELVEAINGVVISAEDSVTLMNVDDSTDEGQKIIADMYLKYEGAVSDDEATELAKKMHKGKLIPEDSIGAQVSELMRLDRKAFESMERFVHARNEPAPSVADIKASLGAPDISTKEGRAEVRESLQRFDVNLDCRELANEMLAKGMITESAYEGQVDELAKLDRAGFKSMERFVKYSGIEKKDTTPEAISDPLVQARNWGAGSDIADAHKKRHSIPSSELREAIRCNVEKEIVIDEPSFRQSIHSVAEKAHNRVGQSKPINLSSYKKRGSIKDRKEESDLKTREEPAFITELREARELLEKFDETFVKAKVEMVRAKEAMLREEGHYNGAKCHEDTSDLYALTKAQLTAQRDFAIIDKVYKQAFKRFALVDVEQATVEELNKVMENYKAADEHTDLDTLFGGKYRTGDDNFYKWLALKRKVISAEEAAELLTDMVGNLPSEMAGVMDKRSAGAVAGHTALDEMD